MHMVVSSTPAVIGDDDYLGGSLNAAAMVRAQIGKGIPAAYVNRLLNGESAPRLYRDLTQAALAEQDGVNRATVAEIGTGRKQGPVATLRALATSLDVPQDEIT